MCGFRGLGFSLQILDVQLGAFLQIGGLRLGFIYADYEGIRHLLWRAFWGEALSNEQTAEASTYLPISFWVMSEIPCTKIVPGQSYWQAFRPLHYLTELQSRVGGSLNPKP